MPKNFTHAGSDQRNRPQGPDRRDILRAAPLAGLAAFLPWTASAAPGPAEQETGNSRHDPVYRQTEAVTRYYERARF